MVVSTQEYIDLGEYEYPTKDEHEEEEYILNALSEQLYNHCELVIGP